MAQVTPAEIGRLLDECGPALGLFAAQYCRTADDVVQEAFLALAACEERPDDPVTWLYAVVRNKARMAGRGDQRRRERELRRAAVANSWFDESVDSQIDAGIAQAALGELEDETREIIIAHLWGELTFAQVAEVVGTSASTAYRRYCEGLKTIRERLGVTWEETQTTTKD